MNYGMFYYGFLPLLGGAVFMWAFIWSRQQRDQRTKQRFLNKLKGQTQFLSWEELKDHYKSEIDFDLDGPFDPNRHGDLYTTLTELEKEAEAFLKQWHS